MIIRTIAKALTQCRTRTQTGWIALAAPAVAELVCSLFAVRLDMVQVPGLVPVPKYTPEAVLPLQPRAYDFHARNLLQLPVAIKGKASRVTPARLPSRILFWGWSGHGVDQDAGSSTVSTTWMTPFDWLTFEIVTIDWPPLASMIQTLPPSCLTVSCSPSAVFSFMPSLRSEAASLPGTT